MSDVERTTWAKLSPSERTELEALVHNAGKDAGAYVSDYGDSTVLWMVGLALGGAGMVATLIQMTQAGLEGLRFYVQALPSVLWTSLYPPGFIVSLAIAVWAAVTWIRNHKRRGVALTSYASIRVKGPKLVLVRHEKVAKVERTDFIRKKSANFTALKLTTKDGATLTLYCTAALAVKLEERLQIHATRSAATA